MINELIDAIKNYYPDFKIGYKDQSTLMKILNKILFWSKDFMTGYTTTVGDTVYFPSQNYVTTKQVTSSVVLLHEIVHVYDEHRLTKFLFGFLYLFPQVLAIGFLILLFISWQISLIFILFLLPIPAFFRMYFEKRAYMAALYSMKKLNDLKDYKIDLDAQNDFHVAQFKSSTYYFMWPFSNIDKEFAAALVKIRNNERPYDDNEVFDMLDDILSKI